MSWLYSQALAAAYLADTCSDGAPFAPSSGSPTPQAYCAPDKMTAFSRPSRFGMTFAPLTDDHGAALLTWYQAGFPARTSAPPEKALASTASDPACGAKWRELSVKYDPATSSWKTHRCLWDEGLPESSLTLPKWGSMRAGVLSERMTSALPTAETDAGLWPTPIATEWKNGCGKTGNRSPEKSAKAGLKLGEAVRMWPTPTVPNGGRSMTQEMALNGGYTAGGQKRQIGLENAVKYWPTPTATMVKQARGNVLKNAEGTLRRGFSLSLPEKVAMVAKKWPTPTVNDSKNCTLPPSQIHHDNIPGALLRDGEQAGGQLNPAWVPHIIQAQQSLLRVWTRSEKNRTLAIRRRRLAARQPRHRHPRSPARQHQPPRGQRCVS